MRRYAFFTLPLLLLFLAGCSDQATAPDLDLTASFKKPSGNPGKPKADAKPEITFAAGTPGNRTLWVVDADGKNATEIYEGGYMMHSSWSDMGNGTTEDPWVILVSQAGAAPQSLEKLELVLEGGVPMVQKITRLADESVYFDAIVKPGGTHFVAVDVYDPEGTSLVLDDMDPDNEVNPIVIYRPGDGLGVGYLSWSPDGNKVAFLEHAEWPNTDVKVRVFDIANNVMEDSPLLEFNWADNGVGNISWSRTTNELLLDLERIIYRVDLSAPALDNPVGEGSRAVWSPDDSKIVYQDGGLFVKTFGVRKDKRLPGGANPDWRRSPGS